VKNTSDRILTPDSVRLTQSSVIQIIYHNVDLKCFFLILQKCLFVVNIIHTYFIHISQSSVEMHLRCGMIYNRKSELMLMRHARAYSSSCSQVILVYLHPFLRNSLLCSQTSRKLTKTTIIGVQGHSRSLMLAFLRSSSPVLVMLSSMSVPICNHFHTKTSQQQINNHFLEGYLSLTLACAGLLKPRGFGLGLLKSTFNAENLVCRLFWSISSHFGAIRS